MEAIYVDLHIHTSLNPNDLNKNYDVSKLLDKIKEVSHNSKHLLSLTDHNTINKDAYLNLVKQADHVILGVELHIHNYDGRPPYHCHIFFNLDEINSGIIDKINRKLDDLYPDKVVTNETLEVPTIENIIRAFDQYDFILLPHGGQSHSTFDKSVPRDVKFDSTIERSIYYNQFDGFTARDNRGLEETITYFKKLGIEGFVNLVTCTDNYNPEKYPNAKSDDAGPFIPTWMFAIPSFDGLRLSLSEQSRLQYSNEKPIRWSEYIKSVYLKNDILDIDIELTPGLNVVIGGSSSGKTLLVDSIARKLGGGFEGSNYIDLGVEDLKIINPSKTEPHYISQNYIMKVIDYNNDDVGIEKIDIIKKVFPEDKEVTASVREELQKLNADIGDLIDSVKIIEEEINNLNRIPIFTRLISEEKLETNPLVSMLPSEEIVVLMQYSEKQFNEDVAYLNKIKMFMNNNLFAETIDIEIKSILEKLDDVFQKSQYEKKIRSVIECEKDEIKAQIALRGQESHSKNENYEKLQASVKQFIVARNKFDNVLKRISEYSYQISSKEVEAIGHKLFIENKFKISKDIFVSVLNKFLKSENKILNFDKITPECLFEANFSKKSPKVKDYDDFEQKVNSEFEKLNKREYKITTKEGRAFENLSAGWKTSVLLDLILGYKEDVAPLIIDQPEDNLATNYINSGLINSIKDIKHQKQVILVSHNATIPMLGDAQNVILCRNEDSIIIRSSRLEGYFEEKSSLDYIAEITDGGKSSIKKRVKKYNLKKFRG